nr:hypothetical protein Iba_chr03bCG4820 [Ipomoea batatas]
MLSTAFSGRSDHLWRQQHEARGLEVSIEISPSNGNPPSMYKSRSDMDISPEEVINVLVRGHHASQKAWTMSALRSYVNNDANTASYIMPSLKYIFNPFPVSWSVNEFASKIDVVTPLDLIINYAIPQRGKDVRGRFVFQSRLQSPHFGRWNVIPRSPIVFVIRHQLNDNAVTGHEIMSFRVFLWLQSIRMALEDGGVDSFPERLKASIAKSVLFGLKNAGAYIPKGYAEKFDDMFTKCGMLVETG